MSLVDKIEELGADAEAGTIDRDVAVQLLLEYSDGGLTRFGASDLIGNWRTARAEYQAIGDTARRSINEILQRMLDAEAAGEVTPDA